jgi:hypothetical protein
MGSLVSIDLALLDGISAHDTARSCSLVWVAKAMAKMLGE